MDRVHTGRWRWIVQGLAVGVIVAIGLFAVTARTQGQPEPMSQAYADTPPVSFGPHELEVFRVWDTRQPSSLPSVAGIGGDREVSVIIAWQPGEHTSDDWTDLSQIDIEIWAVNDDEREELEMLPASQARFDDLSGVVGQADPYWMQYGYAPASRVDADMYELVLRVDGDEYTFTAVREEPL